MFDALEKEYALAHDPTVKQAIAKTLLLMKVGSAGGDVSYEARIELLRNSLEGIASNGTNCKACRMMVEVAREAVERDVILAVDN
jgi:hypothetical protein